jgi:hypothetical protein
MNNKKVFVFGSNLAGRHGKGAALTAYRNHGAIYGQGMGLQGNSYAIPTKDEEINTLPLHKIKQYVDVFIKFAILNPEMKFEVTRIGCGLAGYEDHDVAPMFKNAPENCILPVGWRVLANKQTMEI